MTSKPLPALRTERITDENALPDRVRKGRGAVSNRLSGRFDAPDRYDTTDGWESEDHPDIERVQTILGIDAVRKIISYNDSPDVGSSRSINPYKGCEHVIPTNMNLCTLGNSIKHDRPC